MVEDLVTSGASVMETVEPLQVRLVVVFFVLVVLGRIPAAHPHVHDAKVVFSTKYAASHVGGKMQFQYVRHLL